MAESWRLRCQAGESFRTRHRLRILPLVGQNNEDHEPNAAGQPNQADPLGVPFSFGVIHATPEEYRNADENHRDTDDRPRLPSGF